MGEALSLTTESADTPPPTSPPCTCKPDSSPRGRTPTQRSHTADEAEAAYQDQQHQHKHYQHQRSQDHHHSSPTRHAPSPQIYIVTDTHYPTHATFTTNLGTTTIISLHGSKAAANARAKKLISANDRGSTVDSDKIIDAVKGGLYTGIGVGGTEESEGCCYARKCEVEARGLDEDSEDEGSGGEGEHVGAGCGGLEEIRGRETWRRVREDADVDMG